MSNNNNNSSSSRDNAHKLDHEAHHSHDAGPDSLAKRVGAPNEPPSRFDRLLLEHLDSNLFRGRKENLWHPLGARGIYGGQLIGLALAASMASVNDEEKKVHSLHGYFLRRGDSSKDLIFTVNPLRDGRSYSSRLVTAQQNGESTFVLLASFKKPDLGNTIVNQLKMPSVPDPESLPTQAESYERIATDPRCPERWKSILRQFASMESPIDFRSVLDADFLSEFGDPSAERLKEYPKITDGYKHMVWMKSKVRLSDDPNEHIAVVAYASDDRLLNVSKGKIPLFRVGMTASLDHAMWLHHTNFRADEWLLYVIESPRSADGRGLAFGSIFTADGRHAVTVAQEGVMRLRQNETGNENNTEIVPGSKSKL